MFVFKSAAAAVVTIAVLFAGAAHAQMGGAEAGGIKVQRSSNPNGVQIQGNTNLNTNAQNINTTAVGVGNTADAAIGAIRGGTQIQGNTTINTNAKNVNTTAVGVGNTAKTSIGAIGK
jgi:hypothetical protein